MILLHFAGASVAEVSPVSGTVWTWSNPKTFASAMVVSVQETATAEEQPTTFYIESPQLHRAEVELVYDPEIAGHHATYYDLQTGWKAELSSGFLLSDDKGLLPVPLSEWIDFAQVVIASPDVDGVYFSRLSMSNGVDFSLEHDIHISKQDGVTDLSRLLDAFRDWVARLPEERRLETWDFPVSVVETLGFLNAAAPDSLRRRCPYLEFFAEIVDLGAVLLNGQATREQSSEHWRAEEGVLGGEVAERAGATNLIEVFSRESKDP